MGRRWFWICRGCCRRLCSLCLGRSFRSFSAFRSLFLGSNPLRRFCYLIAGLAGILLGHDEAEAEAEADAGDDWYINMEGANPKMK
jgi:hypothetical protein